ncbi:YcaO-like family protein, partial [Methylophaga sp. UBA1464]
DLDEVASPANLEMHFIDSSGYISNDFFRETPDYDFFDWDYDDATADEFKFLTDKIHGLGFDIYIADYHHLDVYACRILVPGMSDIYPVDELVWENNNEGALFREDFLTLKDGDPEQWQDILDRLDEGGYNDQTPVAPFIGLAPDPGTLWADIRLGELKAMLYLALEDEEAIDWIDWCLALDQASEENILFYRCLKALLEIKWDDERDYAEYSKGLALMYGQQNVDDGIQIVEGEKLFHNLHCPGLSLEGFERHNALLAGYEKLQQAKRTNWK